jgi:hypothetical protein
VVRESGPIVKEFLSVRHAGASPQLWSASRYHTP